jgi:cytochrome c
MKPLLLSRPLIGAMLLLMIAQAACGVGSTAVTALPPTAVGAATEPTQAAQGAATQPAPPAQALPATSTGENATPADAEAMLNAAVQHYQTVGRDQALKDFTDKKPPFSNRDLYVVCLGSDHKMTANGAYPMLVGLSADSIKDPNGKPLGQSVWDVASAVPQGSVPIQWDNPLTGQAESKILYYQKLDQDVCGVAANNQ